jgi:heat shock 70kDa protein 1/2/6/8
MNNNNQETTPKLQICVGIDLGTTNSVVAYYNGHQTIVCPNEFGNRTMPSYVAFNDNEKCVGEAAVKQSAKNPKNTIYESKRFIGRSFADCSREHNNYPFEFVDLGDDNVNFVIKYHNEDRVFCPEEIAALILQKMANIAADFTGCEVTRAVITVPAYFNDAQRQATRDAGRIAGLDVLRIINEPTAAAIAYGMDRKESDTTVLIFDLGGGTIDTSLLQVTRDGIFEVLAIGGDTRLGGADFDQRLMHMVAARYKKEFASELDVHQPRIHRRLRQACEKAKCELSAMQQVDVELDAIGPDGEDFATTITRAEFNDECADLFAKCMELVRSTLRDAKLTTESVHEVVLVGGSTRIPRVQELLSAEFGGKELCKSINPDEAVAYGAAIQAGILNAADTDQVVDCDVVLLDVCPLSLGVETTGGLMSVIISRNSKVPIKKSRIYSTTEDNQTEVTVAVYEGERSNTSDNRLLGTFDLSGIQVAPRGAPKIRVSFEIDADGIFTVTAADESEIKVEASAVEHATLSKTLTIQNNKGRLSNDEVERIVKDAEQLEAQDAVFRQTIKSKTDYESLLYGVRRTFGENAVLQQHADKDTIQCVLDIVSAEFEWLKSLTDAAPSQATIDELQRKRDWLEMEVARPVVDAVNRAVREQSTFTSESHLN